MVIPSWAVLGVPFASFVAPGLIVMAMMQNAFANSSFSLLSGKMQGTIIDLLMPQLIASLPGTFCVLDTSGKYIRWNDRQKELLGLSDAQMASSHAIDFVDAADRPRIMQHIRQTLEHGSATAETRVTGLRGPRDYTFSTMRVNMSSGDYVIAVGSDITLRKQAEREVEAFGSVFGEPADAGVGVLGSNDWTEGEFADLKVFSEIESRAELPAVWIR